MPSDFSWSNAIAIFIAYFTIDMMYALYIICVNRRQAVMAACLTAAIYSLLAFGVVSYSKNIWYLIPLASGAFLGTFVTVRLKK
jgi:hypothetical protein